MIRSAFMFYFEKEKDPFLDSECVSGSLNIEIYHPLFIERNSAIF